MKRKFLSFLMLGAMVFAATSLTSCKDYDDDIQGLKSDVAKLEQALNAAKTDLQGQIAALQGRIQAAEGELVTVKDRISKNEGDIEALQKKVADNLGKISGLEARMEAAEKTLKDLKDLITDLQNNKVDKSEFNEKITDIYGRLEAIDTNLGKALTSIEGLEKGLADEILARKAVEADLAQQKTALENLEKRVKAIEADYLKAADKQELLRKIEEAKNAAIAASKTYTDQEINKVKETLEALSKKVDALQAEVNVLNVLVKNELRSLVFKPDFYYAGIEATKLLSLDYFHFVDSKATGKPIPAADADTQEKKGYAEPNLNVSATNAKRTVHERYDSVQAYKTLNFVAKYHMNPSNADLSKLNTNAVSIISMDRDYVPATRAKGTPVVSVDESEGKGWFTSDGMLNVNLKVNNPTWLKSIAEDEMVTVFATQVAVRSGAKDTTITSDYAALMYEKIKDIRLAHALVNTTDPAKITMTGLLNTHCGSCSAVTKKGATNYKMNGSHLFATVAEAKAFIEKTNRTSDGKKGEGQDTVDWNSTIDLSKLVEVHYTTVKDKHEQLTSDKLAEYGLEYKFELTKLVVGTNKTSESAQAAIKDNILRPQLPEEKTGKGAAYEATEQSRTTINRVPLVRVSLVEKATGHVLDYGYLPIRISETFTEAPVPGGVYVEYTSTDKWTHTQYDDCFGAGASKYGRLTTWIETQYDLMKHNALPESFSRDDFEKNYLDQAGSAGPLYQDPKLATGSTLPENTDEAQQYTVTYGADGKPSFKIVTSTANKVGTITYVPDEDLNGMRTSVFKWEINADQAKELFAKKKDWAIACKLESQNKAYPDIYVIFKTDPNSITFNKATVTGKVDLKNHKIDQYWYALNANNAAGDNGWDEIHTQVKVVEDFFADTAKDLDGTFADVFTGNFKNSTVTPNNWITITTKIDGKTVTNHSNYNKANIKTDFIFESSKNTGSYKGIYQNKLTTFKLFASDKDLAAVKRLTAAQVAKENGKNLYAYVTNPADAQLIAKIEGDDLATMKIALQHSDDNAGYAEALLNYKAHNQLADDVLKAYVSLVAWINYNQTECYIPLTDNTFIVRFLRPINVSNKNTEVIDATSTVNEPQTINLDDLVSYTDWREEWKDDPSYKTFYGVKAVKLRNVQIGDNVSTNPEVTTNLGQNPATKFVPLTEVSDNVDFIYVEEGKLQYRNLSNTVTDFVVKMPVEVEYIWGTIYQDVTVTIKRTQGQGAKKF